MTVVDAADSDGVAAVVGAVDVGRRSDAFLSGEHTGQSGRTQFFQCQMICRSREQLGTENKCTNLVISQLQQLGAESSVILPL